MATCRKTTIALLRTPLSRGVMGRCFPSRLPTDRNSSLIPQPWSQPKLLAQDCSASRFSECVKVWMDDMGGWRDDACASNGQKGGLLGVTATSSASLEVVERLVDALYASLLPNMWLANIDWLPTQQRLLLILLAPRVLPSATLTWVHSDHVISERILHRQWLTSADVD